MTPDEAIEIVASAVLANAAIDVGRDEWESYPSIGEADWAQVITRLEELVDGPSTKDFQAAYDLLAARANHDGDM